MKVPYKELTLEEWDELVELETTKGNLNFCLLKVAEECNELAQLCIKKIHKRVLPADIDEEIIEEIGDLKLRIEFLEEKMSICSQVGDRMMSKGAFLLEFMRANNGSQVTVAHDKI